MPFTVSNIFSLSCSDARVFGGPCIVLATSGSGTTNTVYTSQDALSAALSGSLVAVQNGNVMVEDTTELPRRINEPFKIVTSTRLLMDLLEGTMTTDLSGLLLNSSLFTRPLTEQSGFKFTAMLVTVETHTCRHRCLQSTSEFWAGRLAGLLFTPAPINNNDEEQVETKEERRETKHKGDEMLHWRSCPRAGRSTYSDRAKKSLLYV